MSDKHRQLTRRIRWLPALKEAVRLGTIDNMDSFIKDQVSRFKPKNNKELRSMKDQLSGLLQGNIGVIGGGKSKVLPSLVRLIDSIEEKGDAHGLMRTGKPQTVKQPALPHKASEPKQQLPNKQETLMSPTVSNLVTQTTRFYIKPIEAADVLAVFFNERGEFKDEVKRGRSSLGTALWHALQEGGYVKATGKSGSNTPSKVNKARFMETLFVASDPNRTIFKLSFKRPADLPQEDRTMVARDQFANDLCAIAVIGKPLPPPPVDDAPSRKEDAPPANTSGGEEGILRSSIQSYIETQRKRAEEITEKIRKEEQVLRELEEKRTKHMANHEGLIREQAEVQKTIDDLSAFIK